jgi:very-short-patch-repair endonuclease
MKRPLTQRARALRRRQTVAEIKLWRYLRDLNRAGFQFRHQVPIGPYIVDFASHTHRLVVEVDGSQHGWSREAAGDRARSDWLQSEGYRVLRFWNSDVLLNMPIVIGEIMDAAGDPMVSKASPKESPSP